MRNPTRGGPQADPRQGNSCRDRLRALTPRRQWTAAGALLVAMVSAGLAGCGGGAGGASGTETATAAQTLSSSAANAVEASHPVVLTAQDAVRLADQATFGGSETLLQALRGKDPGVWIAGQLTATGSRYAAGGTEAVHRSTAAGTYCDQPASGGPNCWRDNYSTVPLLWDFYRNALTQPDQLRQRMAYALQQIFVVSGVEVFGTYGLRNYHNMLLDNAFGNYRQLLKKVILSPVMGDYLNHANNDKAGPNENFARELLQLFSIGPCLLNADGSLQGGRCTPAYDNAKVRDYAYALTGWTYPPGGALPGGCWPSGANCRYYGGDMVAVPQFHDTTARTLLTNTSLPAGAPAGTALDRVLDSLMAHQNTAPFVARQIIQHMVSSNPSQAYVARVAAAFSAGQFTSGASRFGSGLAGDLAATVAAVLLDAEARGPASSRASGRLREPALLFTGVLRALNGQTDGDALSWYWGDLLGQHVFRPPSVFNFYPPDYPVAGTRLVGGGFALQTANAAVQRLNFLVYLLDSGGSAPDPSVPAALGTHVDLGAFIADAADAPKLVDRLSLLAVGAPLPSTARRAVIQAVSDWTATTDARAWQTQRVRTAAYLIFGSPHYQVQR